MVYDVIILIGDATFSIEEDNAGFQLLKSFIQTYNMLACDDLIMCSDKCFICKYCCGARAMYRSLFPNAESKDGHK